MLLGDGLAEAAEFVAEAVDLVDERDDHRRGVLVELEILDELLEQPDPRDVGLGEGEAAVGLARTDAVGGDEGAEAGNGEAADAGDDLGLGVDAAHGNTPLRGS